MSLRNQGLVNVANGDKSAKFTVSTQGARESAAFDKDNPRSALIQNGNYTLTCRSARYITERTNFVTKEKTKLPYPRIEARWEVFDTTGKNLGLFRCEHTLPIQVKDGDDVSKSEKFWSNMRRSFADYEGPKALEEYLARDDVAISPEWLEGKTGWAHLEVETSRSGKGRYTNIKYFMGRTEYENAPGPAAGTGVVPPKSDDIPETVGGDDGGGSGYDDADIPF